MAVLSNRVGCVSGAASGIGLATAKRLAKDGAAIALGDVDRHGAEAAAQEIRRQGGDALAVSLDVADADSVAHAVKEVESRLGPIDILVNNAGVESGGAILTTSPEVHGYDGGNRECRCVSSQR